jgi:hypothetical protein
LKLAKQLLVDMINQQPLGHVIERDDQALDLILSDVNKKYTNMKEKFTDRELEAMLLAIMARLELSIAIENIEEDYATV